MESEGAKVEEQPVAVEFVYPKRVRIGTVRIHGDWNNFAGDELIRECEEPGPSLFSTHIHLPSGKFRYFFTINGKRKLSEKHPQELDQDGSLYNVRLVYSRYSLELKRAEKAESYEQIVRRRMKMDQSYGRTFAGVDPSQQLSPGLYKKGAGKRVNGRRALITAPPANGEKDSSAGSSVTSNGSKTHKRDQRDEKPSPGAPRLNFTLRKHDHPRAVQ